MHKAIIIVLAAIVLFFQATRTTWNGISVGDTPEQVIAKLGEPTVDCEVGPVRLLEFPQMRLMLRGGTVYAITIEGNHDLLYARACLAFGLPVASGSESVWHRGDMYVSVQQGRLTAWQN